MSGSSADSSSSSSSSSISSSTGSTTASSLAGSAAGSPGCSSPASVSVTGASETAVSDGCCGALTEFLPDRGRGGRASPVVGGPVGPARGGSGERSAALSLPAVRGTLRCLRGAAGGPVLRVPVGRVALGRGAVGRGHTGRGPTRLRADGLRAGLRRQGARVDDGLVGRGLRLVGVRSGRRHLAEDEELLAQRPEVVREPVQQDA